MLNTLNVANETVYANWLDNIYVCVRAFTQATAKTKENHFLSWHFAVFTF